ncbi:MAG TPA: GH3 auxin-responsive promoter family protein, partial [Pyrinomonadaceae bacterium]|nr:GH3 auxin-responsive promoter family protein [Pyrinomonadaceae bacterium]
MSLLLKTAFRLHGRRASLQLDRATHAPRAVQQAFLLRTLRNNALTAFGSLHNFAGIRTESDYRRRVPVRDYEGFRPFVNRMMAGERAVLTKEQPVMLTMTSGTTGEQKFIPVTRASQRAESRLMRQWLYRALLNHPAYMNERSVAIVSRAGEGHTPSGLAYGSASGMTYKNVPRLIRRSQAIPYPVSELEDYDQRYFLIARFALAAPVAFIITPNPSTLLRLAQILLERTEDLLRAIHDGTLGITARAQADIYAQLSNSLKPDPARARLLASVAAQAGSLRPADCWPNLKLIACWIGGSVGTQAHKLPDVYGAVPLRDLGYIASEGRFTVPFEDYTPSGILALRSNYYEFIPEQEADSAQPSILSSHELEAGRRYSILLTTQGGLYRYRIQDIVEVTGFYNNAPLVAFIRKEGETASITGEKLHVNHLILALDEVRRRSHLDIEQFRAAPDYTTNRYDIYLEIKGHVSPAVLRDEVLPLIDSALASVNVEYAQKRASGRLGAPRLHLMRAGWANKISRRQIASGK